MDYKNAQETAERWGITVRRVQELCKSGTIQGATRFGRAWMIPADAEKPADMRKASNAKLRERAAGASGSLITPMPLMNTPFRPGSALASVERIADADSKNIAMGEYYYFSGNAKKASDIVEKYLTNDDIALRLSACFIYAYANLALDRIVHARQALQQVQKTTENIDDSTPLPYKALAVSIATGASILLHLPLPENLPPMKRFVHILPPGFRLFALYVQAHHNYLKGEYWSSVGIVETALALEGETYPIPSIYLHMVATMDYMRLKEPAQAREHLLAAWELARADNLLEPFGEHHGLLGGMLEAAIKKEWPDDFRRMIAITYNFSAGWRKIHNSDTGHDVADDLTTTEFTVAMLAARNWSNKEISSHLGVSINTVKLHISSALQKLGISQRKELIQYMLK